MTLPVSPSSSVPAASSAVKSATAGGGLIGVLVMLAGLGSSLTGHGSNLVDALTAVGGSGVSLGSLWLFVTHHDKTAANATAWVHAEAHKAEAELHKLEPQLAADVQELVAWYKQNKAGIGSAIEVAQHAFPNQTRAFGMLTTRVVAVEQQLAAKVPAADKAFVEAEIRRLVPEGILNLGRPQPAPAPQPEPAPEPAPAEPAPEPEVAA